MNIDSLQPLLRALKTISKASAHSHRHFSRVRRRKQYLFNIGSITSDKNEI